MSQRQSCDRCRQQKVRCLRDETQKAEKTPSPKGGSSTLRCERCTKAGVECFYSPAPTVAKQRSSRRAGLAAARRGTDTDADARPPNLTLDSANISTNWFEQAQAHVQGGQATLLYPSGPTLQGANFDFSDLVGLEGGFDGWGGAAASGGMFSPTSLNFQSSTTARPTTSTSIVPPASIFSGRDERDDDSEDVYDDDNHDDSLGNLSMQLHTLSRRASRTMRRLVRPGQAPLTVSSPEVNEALEDTNTLIRIIGNITAPEFEKISLDTANATGCGVVFLVLACHQHLVALFRAICEAIHRCLQLKKEHHRSSLDHSDIGPSSIAQFVMVLQLLLHLINRIDRSLFPNDASMNDRRQSSSGYITPITPSLTSHKFTDASHSKTASGSLIPPGGLLVMVQEVVGTIPNDHEKLRQAIQKLQTEMEATER
ncbi:hypothetical protein ONS95_012533 [Cadophora gregata]|uniref:uncharacterized protein n=1 Tax=Cadophora gregata TaxID=51156 RepID=UPI0026DB2F0A|nr:uncharacterized protein ONS95_012533 [Cadophora gregata]KAK0118230.1 hypothetical protein ONS95_012533 [Cadophora gregata]KAK0123304.1 hypothetical protein ONS96_010300 [Cadophora gregata f. sp. sojae]